MSDNIFVLFSCPDRRFRINMLFLLRKSCKKFASPRQTGRDFPVPGSASARESGLRGADPPYEASSRKRLTEACFAHAAFRTDHAGVYDSKASMPQADTLALVRTPLMPTSHEAEQHPGASAPPPHPYISARRTVGALASDRIASSAIHLAANRIERCCAVVHGVEGRPPFPNSIGKSGCPVNAH